MSTAQFFDRYTSTLASAYTSGGSSLVVNSAGSGASALASTGDYYLLVEAEGSNTEEVFKVTARSGTTVTVTGAQAGTSASNHASGATIRGPILTAGCVTQLKTDIVALVSIYDRATWGFAVGTAATVSSIAVPYIVGATGSITKLYIAAGTAPTGSSLIVDVFKNGTTIFGAGTKLVLAAAGTYGTQTTISSPSVAEGDKLTASITQIGSTVAGQDISVVAKILLG